MRAFTLVSVAFVALTASACASRAAPATAPELTSSDRPGAHCRVTVTGTTGCGQSDVETLIAPVRPRIEACRGTQGGTVKIHARAVAGKLAFDVEPGSTLNPTERRCVVDALSSITADESATVWQGAGAPPSGFSSFITIDW